MSLRDVLASLKGRDLSPTARMVAALEAEGVTDQQEIADLIGRTVRMVQIARRELACETHFAKPISQDETSFAKPISRRETHFAETKPISQPERRSSRARIETPSGLVIPKGVEEDSPLPPKGGLDSEPEPNEHIEALKAFEAYNVRALLLGLPQASKLTPDRKRRIGARLRDFGPDGWAKALANLDTPFLRGQTAHRFRADLDFVCQAKSFAKLHDGGYAPAPGASHEADRVSPARYPTKADRLRAAIERAAHDNATVFARRSGGPRDADGDARPVLSSPQAVWS